MLSRCFRALGLLLVLALLAGAGARLDDEEDMDEPNEEMPDEPAGKVVPMPNPGGHTGSIMNLAFSKDGERLYTVGDPGSVMEWDVQTGERLRVWYFPGRAYRLAVSPDGAHLAVVCRGDRTNSAWVIDLSKSGSVEPEFAKAIAGPLCGCVALSPGAKQLAVSYKDPDNKAASRNDVEVHSLKEKGKSVILNKTGNPLSLDFDPSGSRLLIGRNPASGAAVQLWDLSAAPQRRPFPIPDKAPATYTAWSPDGKLSAGLSGGQGWPTLRVWPVDPEPKSPRTAGRDRMMKAMRSKNSLPKKSLIGVAFASGKTAVAAWEMDGHVVLGLLHAGTGKFEAWRTKVTVQPGAVPRMAVDAGGRWLAVTSNPSYQVALYDLKGRREARRIGPKMKLPEEVAWASAGKGIAWGFGQASLAGGVDLDGLKPMEKADLDSARRGGLPAGWKLAHAKRTGIVVTRPGGRSAVLSGSKQPRLSPWVAFARVYKDKAGNDRLLVLRDKRHHIGMADPVTGSVILEGKKKPAHVGSWYPRVADMAVSGDGKYLLVAGGGQALDLYRLDSPAKPLLRLLVHGQDRVAWTEEGYYAGTPGGEKLLGWKVAPADDRPAKFYPAATFHRRLYNPGLIQELLGAGSVEAALKKVEKPGAKARSVEEMLPPTVTITRADKDPKDDRKWVITAAAESAGGKGQAVESLKLLVDGRPLPGDPGAPRRLKAGEKAATWEVAGMPPGRLELKVLARGPDVFGVSPPKEITVPAPLAERPALHVVSVGLTYKGDKALDLGPCPGNDATEVAAQFPKSCVGKTNLFGSARKSQLLIDKAAGKDGVLAALAKVKKDVRPRDLVVFFYAGHGVNEKNEFFLLTHGADLRDLPKTALSGEKLREALGDFPCQVLVLLDACHSGKAGEALRQRGYKPATDEASRNLADEECSVTLIAAAMGHQRALQPEGGKHGFFTQAVLRTLARNKDVAHNRSNHQQYVHHLFSDVFDEVQALTKDRQHPTLSLPWTVESYPVRRLPLK